MMLGDLGAEVIKVENPHGGDDTRGWGPPFVYPVDWIRPQLSVATNCRGPNRRARSATGRRGPAGKARLRCPSQCLAKGVLANFSSITGEKDSSALRGRCFTTICCV
jgi:hypothetical protein